MVEINLKKGDKVTWSSQSQASRTTKEGVVCEVVQHGQQPSRVLWPSLYKGAGCGMARSHTSYVVLVGKKPYWPRVSALREVEP